MRRTNKGFTLVEMMIVVTIIGILSAVAAGKVSDAIRRSIEARTKGNLAILRASISVYVSNTGGIFPTDLNELTAGPLPVLDKLPLKATPPYHGEGNLVSNGGNADMASSGGDWFYFNVPSELEFGTVVVNCIHADLKGNKWSSY